MSSVANQTISTTRFQKIRFEMTTEPDFAVRIVNSDLDPGVLACAPDALDPEDIAHRRHLSHKDIKSILPVSIENMIGAESDLGGLRICLKIKKEGN